MSIAPGNTGEFVTQLTEGRWRRQSWAFWTRLASFDYTNTAGVVLGVIGELAHLTGTRWAVSHRRNRNSGGAPNTTTGGLCWDYWWNGVDVAPGTYFGISTADVICTYVRQPDMVDIYLGNYSGGWPTMESMTLWATLRMQPITTFFTNYPISAGNISIRFYLGGSAASASTYEIIIDRWRLTAWGG
jgi:hypothetical protein